jgi:hypothetical protein
MDRVSSLRYRVYCLPRWVQGNSTTYDQELQEEHWLTATLHLYRPHYRKQLPWSRNRMKAAHRTQNRPLLR